MTRILTIIALLFATPAVAFDDTTLVCDADEFMAHFELDAITSHNSRSHTIRFSGNKAFVKIRGSEIDVEYQEIRNMNNIKMYHAKHFQGVMVVPQIGPLTITIHSLSRAVAYQKNLTCSVLD